MQTPRSRALIGANSRLIINRRAAYSRVFKDPSAFQNFVL